VPILVLFVDTGHRAPSYTINGLDIEDIDIIPSETNGSTPPAPPQPPHPPYFQAPPTLPIIQPPPPPLPPAQAQTYSQPLSQLPSNQFSRPATAVHSPQIPATSGQFIDPAIISISQKPEANAAPNAQASIPNAKNKPSYSTPPRMATAGSSIASAAAAIRPPNPPALKRNSSSQGVSVAPINTLAVPTSLGPHPLSASAAPDPSRPVGLGHSLPVRGPVSASVLQVPFRDLSLRGDAALESSAFDETDDAASNVAMPPTPYARPPFSRRRSRRGKAQTRSNEQCPPLEPTAPEELTQKDTLSHGIFGGPIPQAVSSGGAGLLQPGAINPDKRRRQRRRERRNDGNSNAEEEGWATEDVNDYKAREFDFQGNLDRFDKEGLFNRMKVIC